MMKAILEKAQGFLRFWPEPWALPLGVAGLYASYLLLWLLFPFSAPFPPEALQRFLFAGFGLMLFNALSWLGIKLNLFGVYDYYKQNFSNSFKRLKAWQKVSFLFGAYFGYIFLLVQLAALV